MEHHVTIVKHDGMKIMLVNCRSLGDTVELFEDALRGHGFHFNGCLVLEEEDDATSQQDECA